MCKPHAAVTCSALMSGSHWCHVPGITPQGLVQCMLPQMRNLSIAWHAEVPVSAPLALPTHVQC